ncbi:IclR family transcriptional regulator [Methylobacterium crusticola]|nr:IclR family transcriptional regulator [Methylobacterium crusticola]
MEKALAILEYLAPRPHGASLVSIATDLNQIRSGCHRTLNELVRYGYVRALPQRGEYALTTKLSSMGMSFLSKSGIIDVAQPVMNRLARETEELVRLAILDGTRLTLVAKAVGSKVGLLYDPDMGIDLRLSCSAAGHAWLATLTDQQATEAVVRQGLGDPAHYGPNAPVTVSALLAMLQAHRTRGFSMIEDMYALGMNSMAAVIRRKGEPAVGALIVAGPTSRFTRERMLHVGSSLVRRANELALIGSASPLLKADDRGTWGNMA